MYSRDTELRHLQPNDVHTLAIILDDNDRWRNLMEIIPKNPHVSDGSGDDRPEVGRADSVAGMKYNHDHIRQFESAFRRPGETRLYTEILFQEWGSSGRRHERPTVGVLLQLLVRAELFRAADFVAEKFLNEPKPPRPQNGPGARISISLSDEDFDDIKSMVEDSSFYPETAALNDNANYVNNVAAENNKDYYTKYHQRVDKQVLSLASVTTAKAINEHTDDFAGEAAAAPKPPPRMLRSARLQQQQLLQQQQQQTASEKTAATAITAEAKTVAPSELKQENRQQAPLNNGIDALPATQNLLPKFSTLMTSAASVTATDIGDSSAQSRNTEESTILSEAPIPLISILAEKTTTAANTTKTEIKTGALGEAKAPANAMTTDTNEILPVISALNLNGEHAITAVGRVNESTPINLTDSSTNRSNSCSSSDRSRSSSLSDDDDDHDVDIELPHYNDDDEDDDDDNSMPMLSILDQRSSNNDSSLTTVTGTSGENSFELSMNDNGSFSASNENIPCLSALKQ